VTNLHLGLLRPLALLPALFGCGADLGMGAGVASGTAHAVAVSRLTLATKPTSSPMNEKGFMAGVVLEQHFEHRVGSRFDFGLLVGWSTETQSIADFCSGEAFLQVGTPARSNLFHHGAMHLDLGAALPIPLNNKRHVTQVNRSTWVLQPRLELVPFARVRTSKDEPLERSLFHDYEVVGGLAARYRIMSDLF
jgi:hypothetical protein